MNNHAYAKLVYGRQNLDDETTITILLRDDAEQAASAFTAAQESSTWGEFKAKCPKKYFDGFDADELPDDDEIISIEQIASLLGQGDEHWPPIPPSIFGDWIPDDLASEYGVNIQTLLDGVFVVFRESDLSAVTDALQKTGHECVEDQNLIDRAWGGAT